MRKKIASVLEKTMIKKDRAEEADIQVRTLAISPTNIDLVASATEIEIEATLKDIAKNKSAEEIPELIKRYNILMAIKDEALTAEIDGMNACAYLPVLEEQKQLLIDCLVQLRNNTRALSKTQDGEEYDKSCSNIHNTNMLIHQLQNLYIDIIEEVEVDAIEEV